jgi:cytoskeleton protein RodZ
MTSVGETLRRERLKQKLDLDSISSQLKIAPRLLEAIEGDHYEQLPGAVFAKAFVRQYARLLSLDEEALAAEMQRNIQPEPPQISEKPKPSVSPVGVEKIEEWRTVGDRGFKVSGPLSAAALMVVVIMICSGVYAWTQRPRKTSPPPRTSAAAAPASQPAQAAPPPVTTPAIVAPPVSQVTPPVVQSGPVTGLGSDAPAAMASAPAAAAPVAKPAPATPPAPRPRGPVHIEIEAQETVWILVRTDGKYDFSGTMEANTSRTVDAERDIVLRLGNAGGVTISLNGKPIGPAGPKGQVRTIQLTSGGFQMVSPNPAAGPDRL